jgi:hypothetical protein
MATPAAPSLPTLETQGLQDEKTAEAYIQGHDAPEHQPQIPPEADMEKGVPSKTTSTHSDDPTLGDASTTREAQDHDPNIVDWDGLSDPENPQNWPKSKKWRLVFCLSLITLITPLASSFFAPGVPQVLATFHESSNVIAGLVVSIYILGFAIGPLIIAPMSELYGRYIVYNVCHAFFIVFTICCAVSNSMGMLIAFRLLAGCAGSAPLTLGGGTIADLFPPEGETSRSKPL